MAERRTLVIGSGAGGLTMALLLARAGRPVTLLEVQKTIGGNLRRFVRGGVRFDTGYHFAGGLAGVTGQLMELLGIADLVKHHPISNRIFLAASGNDIVLPAGCGIDGAIDVYSRRFPGDAAGVKAFYSALREVWRTTPMHDLTRNDSSATPMLSRYDLNTVDELCGSWGLSPAAATALNSFALCHGTPPELAPMSFHARVGYSLCEELSRPDGGGDTLIEAFDREAAKLGIEVRAGTTVERFASRDADGKYREAVLTDGTTLPVEEVYFTNHPASVLAMLPPEARNPALTRRCARLRESTSFFCAYFTVDGGSPEGLISYLSHDDLDLILNHRDGAYSTGYMIENEPDANGNLVTAISSFRTVPPVFEAPSLNHAARLKDSAYQEYKARLAGEIADDLVKVRPELKGRLRLRECGSALTCRDYAPPYGSAYGACCVVGEARLCGHIGSNFHIAGQSAMVPGVLGTMLTSLSVCRRNGIAG